MTLNKLLIALISLASLTSCHKVTLVVDGVPENTPPDAQVFVAGNFNAWDTGDRTFMLKPNGSRRYTIDLPAGWGTVAYKFTRGDWTSVETDACGHEIQNHLVDYFWKDTVYQRIESWKDLGPTHCPKVVVRLKKLPKETPAQDPVFLAGNFNNWSDQDPNFRMKPDKKGELLCTLNEASGPVEFKFTRGSWEKEEADAHGNKIENRQFQPGTQDTIDVKIDGWVDIDPGDEARRVTFLVRVPPTTPPLDTLFLVGSFNDWNPHDLRYIMRRARPNVYVLTVNKPKGKLEYKVTRGSWNKEEVDSYGVPVGNHLIRTLNDTVEVNVIRWKDDPAVMASQDKVWFEAPAPPAPPVYPYQNQADNAVHVSADMKALAEAQLAWDKAREGLFEASTRLASAEKSGNAKAIKQANDAVKRAEKELDKSIEKRAEMQIRIKMQKQIESVNINVQNKFQSSADQKAGDHQMKQALIRLRGMEIELKAAAKRVEIAAKQRNNKEVVQAETEFRNKQGQIQDLLKKIDALQSGKTLNMPIDLKPGEAPVTIVVKNNGKGEAVIFLRAELPGNNQESYRIQEHIEPGKTRQITMPTGTRLYITEGPPEGGSTPRERFYSRIFSRDNGKVIDASELDWKK